jgi:predicted O-methyltransferase YrrM
MEAPMIKMSDADAAAHRVQLQFLAAHCRQHSPNSYLEIGTREGDSLRAVLDNSPTLSRVVCADTWGGEYGGTGRGSHSHIDEIVSRYGNVASFRCLDGDSKLTIPQISDERFDLILVDGDHSLDGARADLINVSSLVSPGGFVLLHDICHPAHFYLSKLFDLWVEENSDAITSSFSSFDGYGFGVARLK